VRGVEALIGFHGLAEVRDLAADTLLEAYTYDIRGNRLTKNTGGTVTYYTYDAANQLTQLLASQPEALHPV
jgi:hypothetical protein